MNLLTLEDEGTTTFRCQ